MQKIFDAQQQLDVYGGNNHVGPGYIEMSTGGTTTAGATTLPFLAIIGEVALGFPGGEGGQSCWDTTGIHA